MSLFEDAGGEEKLRQVIADFYDHVFDDLMIGFFFRRSNKERLIQKELELVAEALGSTELKYTGKDMQRAHAAHGIQGGHFERRMQLLREAMDRGNVPQHVREKWLEHAYGLRGQITKMAGSGCE